MPSNSVGGVSVSVYLDDKDALQQLAKLRRKIEDTQKALAEKRVQRDSIAAEMERAEIATERARQRVKQLQAQLSAAAPDARAGIRARLTEANAELRQQVSHMDALNRQWQKLDADIASGEKNLEGMAGQAGNLETQVKASSGALTQLKNAATKATKHMERSFARLGRMIRRVFVFTVILRALRAIREYLSNLLLSFPEIRQAISELKGNLLTAFQPIFERLIPVVTRFLQILVQISAVLADIIAKIFGTTAARAQEGAKALNEQAEAYKAAGTAAKKASKQLAGFDQLNVLSNNESSGGGSSSDTAPSFNTDFESSIGAAIEGIDLLVGASLLALGAILAFSGINIPLGITLMALGAAAIYAAFSGDEEALKNSIAGKIGDILLLISGALLVLGTILAFSGANIPLGIALMAIGAAGIAAEVALNWEALKEKLQGPIGKIVAIVSAALLVLGAILAFSGAALPLGIALMVLGAAGLAAEIELNWDTIKQKLQGPLGKIAAIVSAALLVLGAVLTFSGANLPLGIGLMIAGAAGLATVAALNWDKIKTILTGKFAGIAALISAGLLVLGVILTIAGILPLGIALIVAGAAGLVTVTALNWDAIKEKIADVWNGIKQWWQAHVAPIFTSEWWAEKFASISEGLKQKVKDGVNAAIDLFNSFIDWINRKMNISWGSFSLFGQEVIPAGNFQLLTIPRIPRLAAGAVIPPNREFVAVLGDQKSGTNIETPLQTMIDAFRQALTEGGYGDAVVNLYLDGEKVASNTVKHINRSARAGGKLGIV